MAKEPGAMQAFADLQFSAMPPDIPESYRNWARDYRPTQSFLSTVGANLDSGKEAARVRNEVIAMREAWENITDPSEKGRQLHILQSREQVADQLEALFEEEKAALIAQQASDPSAAPYVPPTQEDIYGPFRDMFGGTVRGSEFIERRLAEPGFFDPLNLQLGDFEAAERLRHPQTIAPDPGPTVQSFYEEQLPILTQDLRKEQLEEQDRRRVLADTGSTIFKRRTL